MGKNSNSVLLTPKRTPIYTLDLHSIRCWLGGWRCCEKDSGNSPSASDWWEMVYRTQLPGPSGGRDLRCVLCTASLSSPRDRVWAAPNGKRFDGTQFFRFLCFPHFSTAPAGVSWDHAPNKPHTLQSLPQRLVLGEPEGEQISFMHSATKRAKPVMALSSLETRLQPHHWWKCKMLRFFGKQLGSFL